MAQQAAVLMRVRRKEAELVVPTKPSPRELKPLSDLDNHLILRHHVSMTMMYRNNVSMNIIGKDPVEVIRKAVAEALVFYYPLAGRLREGPDRKLSVDCTDEGVVFVEADADFALHDLGEELMPPFPCLEGLLFDVPASSFGGLHCPLVLIQVTRLKCGGFIFTLGIIHALSDAQGKEQFISAIAEMARGALSPTTRPCWSREFFSARYPPCGIRHDNVNDITMSRKRLILEDLVEKSFRFNRSHVSALRMLAPQNLRRHCSTFDLLTACLWRSRTAALELSPTDQVHLIFTVNARGRDLNPPVPAGYYGNAMVGKMVSSSVGSLRGEPFGYTLELVMKAKADVTEEYIRSYVDQIAIKRGGHPLPKLPTERCFFVTDVRRIGYVDFGWGTAAYAGPSFSVAAPGGGLVTSYVMGEGGDEIIAPLRLPRATMKIFETQLHAMLLNSFIRSSL